MLESNRLRYRLEKSVTTERAFTLVDRAIGKLPRPWLLSAALLGVAVVGVPDYLTGSEISLSVFYLCPVGIATWYAGLYSGMVIALISALSALAGDIGEGHHLTQPLLMAWNALLHFAFMLVVVYLLDRLRFHLGRERELARSDPVTGIANARAFMEHLQYRLDLAARTDEPISLAYVDLDDFKRINDQGGHDEGDRILRLVAQTLKESIRRTDVVARLGGDEFAFLIQGADQTSAESLIGKVRQSLVRAFERERSVVTCSIGCVTFHGKRPTATAAINAADSLMYAVKRRGKNATVFEVLAAD
jgi:diguanylate cyclase (GGDEF)-like protein